MLCRYITFNLITWSDPLFRCAAGVGKNRMWADFGSFFARAVSNSPRSALTYFRSLLRAFIGSRRCGAHEHSTGQSLVSDVRLCLTVTPHTAVTFDSNSDLPTYPSRPKTCEKCTYLPMPSAKRGTTDTPTWQGAEDQGDFLEHGADLGQQIP